MTTEVLSREAELRGVFDRTDEMSAAGHEQIVFCRDVETGLRAIISVHDTTLGPALGGTRFYPYPTEVDALTDALRLSQGMTFKAAAAGMPLGGGKAVIIGDPGIVKSAALLRAYGRFVETLGGRYVTAADVGTTSEDLDIIGQATQHVTGCTEEAGGSGDSGFSTAYGVFCSMLSASESVWGTSGLRGRTVGVEGAGKVGFHLVGLLLDEGANVLLSDPHEPAIARVLDAYKDVRIVPRVIDARVDIYAPCALGGTLTRSSVESITAKVVCGAANNQLLTTDVDELLATRDVLWVPDYVANAGGLIQVGSELQDKSEEDMLADVARIGDTVEDILAESARLREPTGVSASRLVQMRLAAGRQSLKAEVQ